MTKTDNDFSFNFEENNNLVYDTVQLLNTAQDLAENFASVVNQYDRQPCQNSVNSIVIEALHIRKRLLALIMVSQRMLENCYESNDHLISEYIDKSI